MICHSFRFGFTPNGQGVTSEANINLFWLDPGQGSFNHHPILGVIHINRGGLCRAKGEESVGSKEPLVEQAIYRSSQVGKGAVAY